MVYLEPLIYSHNSNEIEEINYRKRSQNQTTLIYKNI